MTILSDVRVLFHLLTARRTGSHTEWLEGFYSGQAQSYDDFRQRLLHGRDELLQLIDTPKDGVWVDLGGGTGSNIAKIPNLQQVGKVYIVDLCDSLLEVARTRIQRNGWRNVVAIREDATEFVPLEQKVDVVTFSYSLTMIPNWEMAIEQAFRILKPGGVLGVVDFTVNPMDSKLAQSFWPWWFKHDRVRLNREHVKKLQTCFPQGQLTMTHGKVPYLFGLSAPYYLFVGKKPL